MVRRVKVERVPPGLSRLRTFFREPDCKVSFTPLGTNVILNGISYTTEKNHWLDMELEDFAEVFQTDPAEIEDWFNSTWERITKILKSTENVFPPRLHLSVTSITNYG